MAATLQTKFSDKILFNDKLLILIEILLNICSSGSNLQ